MKKISEKPYSLCFETLSNELRVKVLQELKKGAKTVQELSKKLNAEQSRLSHSLQILRECNFVESKTKGKNRLYFLKTGIVKEIKKEKDIFSVIDSHIKESCNNECKKRKSSTPGKRKH
jgi:DNA-binding transcriptional ArsR family regulator